MSAPATHAASSTPSLALCLRKRGAVSEIREEVTCIHCQKALVAWDAEFVRIASKNSRSNYLMMQG